MVVRDRLVGVGGRWRLHSHGGGRQMPQQSPLTGPRLRALSADRLRDAEVLYAAGRYDACAYMSGYVLEAALKARIVRLLRLTEYPEKDNTFRVHDLARLSMLGGLDRDINANLAVKANWSVVSDWDVAWRYRPLGAVNQSEALRRLDALRDSPDGVLVWLKRRW